MGVRSDKIESILGYGYGPDIVHRNNMALADNASEISAQADSKPTERAAGR